jgi:hypothetical protein
MTTTIGDSKTEAAAVSACFRYAMQVSRDVQAMLAFADEALTSKGLVSLGDSEAAYVSERFDEPEYWVATTISRGYAPLSGPKSTEPVSTFRFIEVYLTPHFVDEPILLFGRCDLAEPLPRKSAYTWIDWPAELLSAGTAHHTPIVMDGASLQGLHAKASALSLMVVPLVSVTGKSAVTKLVVEPLLAL